MGKVLKINLSQVIKIQAESCDVHPGSPIIDVEGMSDENEEEVMEDGQRSSEDHEETSEDQKVLSLAEQFIAAMPARIKNENQSNEGSSANCEGTYTFVARFPYWIFLKTIHSCNQANVPLLRRGRHLPSAPEVLYPGELETLSPTWGSSQWTAPVSELGPSSVSAPGPNSTGTLTSTSTSETAVTGRALPLTPQAPPSPCRPQAPAV